MLIHGNGVTLRTIQLRPTAQSADIPLRDRRPTDCGRGRAIREGVCSAPIQPPAIRAGGWNEGGNVGKHARAGGAVSTFRVSPFRTYGQPTPGLRSAALCLLIASSAVFAALLRTNDGNSGCRRARCSSPNRIVEGREGESGRLRVAIVGIIGAGGSRNVYSK